MANNTSKDAPFTGAWYSRMVVKYQGYNSAAPADVNK